MRRRTLNIVLVMLIAVGSFGWVAAQNAPASLVQTAQLTQSTLDDWNKGVLDGVITSNNSDGEILLDANSTAGTFTSTGYETPFTVTAVAAQWDVDLPATTALSLEVRTSPNGTEWRDWLVMPVIQTISSTQVFAPIGVDADAKWLQYRINFSTQAQPAVPTVKSVAWTLFDASNGPTLTDQPDRVPALSEIATNTRPPSVITRTSWGAATTKPNLTPSRPRRIELTALPSASDAPTFLRTLQAAALNAGSYDLPYAYVVDSAGNIYQGHTGFVAENGTVNIALLGDATEAAQVGLGQLIAWLAQAYDLPLSLNVNGAITAVQADAIRVNADQNTVRSRWTFVESNTFGYNERLMFFNPTDQPAKAFVTFLPGQANAVRRELTIEPKQRVNLIANDIFSDTADLPIEVTANQQIIAERTMLFANDALGESGIDQFSRTWYFAEGDGTQNRSTTIWLYNPQASEVAADVLVIASDGISQTERLVLAPFTRTAFEPSQDTAKQFGVRVAATAPIAAERTVLIGANNNGGFLTKGAIAPSMTWYFAEGATISPFSTTLALLNPNSVSTAITTTFMTEQGSTFTRRYQIPSYSRLTVDMRDIVPSPQGVGTVVTASQPIVAERTTYFNNDNAATNSMGATELAYVWNFAEGRTADPATEFIIMLNPNQKPANVTLTIGKEDGTTKTLNYTIPRTGRIAILLDNEEPFEQSHWTTVASNLPIVAERTILIDNAGGGGGHSALGTPEK